MQLTSKQALRTVAFTLAVGCVSFACGGGGDATSVDQTGDAGGRPLEAASDATPGNHVPLSTLDAYLKGDRALYKESLGSDVAISGDGTVFVVGARNNESCSRGVHPKMPGPTFDCHDSGAAYIFRRDAEGWTREAFLKASNANVVDAKTELNDEFGATVAISDDGSTVAIGAPRESSCGEGVGGAQQDDNCPGAGAVYVFHYDGAWKQRAYLKASNTKSVYDDQPKGQYSETNFGGSIAVSGDGSLVVVANPGSSFLASSKNVYAEIDIFERIGDTYKPKPPVKAPAGFQFESQNWPVALSADGATIAARTRSYPAASKVQLFTRDGDAWKPTALLAASNEEVPDAGVLVNDDYFGASISISNDGSVVAVGAPAESSCSPSFDKDPKSNACMSAGAVYLFRKGASSWSEEAMLKASNAKPYSDTELHPVRGFGANSFYGRAVSLSGDGSAVAVGVGDESSCAKGLNGDQSQTKDEPGSYDPNDPYHAGSGDQCVRTGAVYFFRRAAKGWTQESYVKATNLAKDFGTSVALSKGGTTLAVGAPGESWCAAGINGNQWDDGGKDGCFLSGAAYIYR